MNNPSAVDKNVSATKPVPMADMQGWRQLQIAAAQPVTSKNTSFRSDELVGTEVRSPQNEALGSVEDLVMSPQTDKIAYLVIALDGSFGIDEKNVPVPLEDFKITPNANLLVLDTTKGALDAAPRVTRTNSQPPAIRSAESEGGCLLEGPPHELRQRSVQRTIHILRTFEPPFKSESDTWPHREVVRTLRRAGLLEVCSNETKEKR